MRDIDPLSTTAAMDRLRGLPAETVEPYGWQEFRRRASDVGRITRETTSSALAFRAAAALLLVSGAAALTASMWSTSAPGSRDVPVASTKAPEDGEASGPTRRSDRFGSRAKAPELWLARQPAPAMVRVGSYAAVVGLEDRIAQLDDLLTTARAEGMQSAKLSPLVEQRADLMNSLAQVRYAERLVAGSPP